MKRAIWLVPFILISCLAPAAAPAAPAADPIDLLLILDASGSMWGQIDGENKIVIARQVLDELLEGLPDETEVGLVAYGHRREGDCGDIETVVPMGALDREALQATIGAINPKGKTPITGSVEEAFAIAGSREAPTTIVLVSDGLETCGGDPCAAVREAKERGIDFVMHVVGFDVAEEDVSQLECAAQAGDGLFLGAEDAAELGGALDQAVAMPAGLPGGRLSVKVTADGELFDGAVHVTRSADGAEAGGGRTYSKPDTNPRVIPLPDGTYDVEVVGVALKGDIRRTFVGVEIAEEGEAVELEVDFSSGELAVGVTRNGELSDAAVRVRVAGESQEVAAGRTYTSESSNPETFRLTAGEYDVSVGSVEISNGPERLWEGVVVEPGGRTELAHDFPSGTLRIGAVVGGELADATVNVSDAAGGPAVAAGRTYTSDSSNPRTFVLTPGRYKVALRGVRVEGDPRRELEVEVRQGETTEHIVDLAGE